MTEPHDTEADRAILADFLHHTEQECDQAAERLQKSPHRQDRMIATEWLTIRRSERPK